MKLSPRRIRNFQNKIFSWWHENRRDLPWRHTRDPYRIFVSEVMLQQTQVDRVLPKYDEFLYFFPDVYSLARATPAQVLKVWKGMGYNRRALYIRKSARLVVEKYQGLLTKLPGVGTYTARAILVFAFGQSVPLVDTNIRKIVTHYFFRDKPQKEKVIEQVAAQLIPDNKPWEWHQALMDYAALELRNIRINKYANLQMNKIPFKQSNRFYRGRMIDQLREGSMGETKLLEYFTKQYGKPKDFLRFIIQGLEADGLIDRTKSNVLRLPR